MIRAFQPTDADRIIQIWLDASIEAHAFIERSFWENRAAELRDRYLPDSETFVYCDDEHPEDILAFASLQQNHLAALFVAPAHQDRGIGGQLLEFVRGKRPKLTLSVYVENARAVAFYERHGFRMVHCQVDDHTGHYCHWAEESR